jgi:hypothetical protein
MNFGAFVFLPVSQDPQYCRGDGGKNNSGYCPHEYTDGIRRLCRLYGELKELPTFHVARAPACIEASTKVAALLKRCEALAGDVVVEFAVSGSELVGGMFADDAACLEPFCVPE